MLQYRLVENPVYCNQLEQIKETVDFYCLSLCCDLGNGAYCGLIYTGSYVSNLTFQLHKLSLLVAMLYVQCIRGLSRMGHAGGRE
jgi:hypothetical protein